MTELKRTPAPALERVRDGEEVLVTQDGIPFMRLVPVGRNSRFEELVASGVIHAPARPRDVSEIRAASLLSRRKTKA